jgi:phosphatidylglycerophosphate synthase
VLAAVALLDLVLDALDGWLARRSSRASEFGARYDIESDAFLVMALSVLLYHRGLAGPWVILAGAWRYLYVLAPLVLPTPVGEAPRSRRGRFAYIVMMTCFILALALPASIAAPLSLLGTLVVSQSFLHSFWMRYIRPSRVDATENIGA